MKRKKKYTKAILILPALIIAYISYLCILHSEWGAKCYLNSHRSEIEEFALACLENGLQEDSYHGWQVDCYKDNEQVEFLVSASGFGSSTSYTGIYYSARNIPLGFQGGNVDFVPYENGWRWKEGNGDNWQYTERISENWFWFEIHF